jgi:pyruvate,orthophosphate dikinase
MYGDVVMGLKPVSKEEHDPFEVIIDMVKDKKGVSSTPSSTPPTCRSWWRASRR